MLSQDDIKHALAAVKYPGFSRDIVSFGLIKEISAANGAVSVALQLTSPNPDAARQIKIDAERVLKNLPGVNQVHVEVRQPTAGQAATGNAFANQAKVPGVKRGIAIATRNPGLFEKNPDVDKIIRQSDSPLNRLGRAGLPLRTLAQSGYDAARDADVPPDEHVLIRMCRLAGVTGPVELRPYIFLTKAELAAGRLVENQVAIQSTGLAAPLALLNREWYPQRFQELCAQLRTDVRVVQIGSSSDMKLEGAIDLRGKTSLRQTAAVLANSLLFVGLVGFVMHLARAVDCRSVIIYGGREKPALTGYVANKNLYQQVRCAPCWLRARTSGGVWRCREIWKAPWFDSAIR